MTNKIYHCHQQYTIQTQCSRKIHKWTIELEHRSKAQNVGNSMSYLGGGLNFRCNIPACPYNMIQYDKTLHTALQWLKQNIKSEFKLTKDTPQLALMSELWGVSCEDMGEHWPSYSCADVYIPSGKLNLCCCDPAVVLVTEGKSWHVTWDLTRSLGPSYNDGFMQDCNNSSVLRRQQYPW